VESIPLNSIFLVQVNSVILPSSKPSDLFTTGLSGYSVYSCQHKKRASSAWMLFLKKHHSEKQKNRRVVDRQRIRQKYPQRKRKTADFFMD